MKNKINITNILIIVSIIVIVFMGIEIEKLLQNKSDLEEEILNAATEEYLNNMELIAAENTIASEKGNNESNKLSHFILYNGQEMQLKTGMQYLDHMEITDENKAKYISTLYTYEKGKYIGEVEGDFGEETYGGVSIVKNAERISISEKYNPYPRSFTELPELPEGIKEKRDYTDVEVNVIDLDGDGKNEYIVCYIIEDELKVAKSEIVVYDSNFNKVDKLAYIEEGFWYGIHELINKRNLSLDDVEYLDIDKDDKMEILVEIPVYEGEGVSVYKYDNGKIIGDTNFEVILKP